MSRTSQEANGKAIGIEVNALDTPWRIAHVQAQRTVRVQRPKARMVMTFPHLILRETIAFELLSVVVVLISLFADAPLEEHANPVKTPNPAKAPWYFLGLQELLHYYPPVVAGVLIPLLVVVGLVAIPYVRANINQIPLTRAKPRTVRVATACVALLASALWLVDQHGASGLPLVGQVWWLFPEAVALDLYIPTVLVWLVPFVLTYANGQTCVTRFLRSRGLPFWIMTWFTVLATTLTVVGTFFRGAGWALVTPW